MRMVLFTAALCMAGSLASGQGSPIAYPQDTTTFNVGNGTPFGALPRPLPSIDEGRCQQLIPATHLPTVAGKMTGLGVMNQLFTGRQSYPLLRITMSHTTATSLQPTFADNLPSPVVVLDGTDVTIDWVRQEWVTVGFEVPFAHDGVSNIVIDIQKITVPLASSLSVTSVSANPGRSDLPGVFVISGAAGSGAWTSPIGVGPLAPLQLRLYTEAAPTLVLRSDRSGSGNVFSLGGPVDVMVYAPPGSVYCAFVDGGFGPRYTLPVARGAGVVMPVLEIGAGMVASSPAVMRHMIRRDAALVGLHGSFQAAVLEPAASRVIFTNGADAIVRP